MGSVLDGWAITTNNKKIPLKRGKEGKIQKYTETDQMTNKFFFQKTNWLATATNWGVNYVESCHLDESNLV